MKIPIKYNIRSILIRRVGSAMTAVGIGLTVAVVVVMMAMVNGLDRTFTETGDDQNLVVLREGSLNEVNSYFTRDAFETVRFLPGVMRDEENEPLAVLLVDTIEKNRILVARLLRRLFGRRVRILQAGDGRAALELMDRQAIDAALVDVRLPDVDGAELLERVLATMACKAAVKAGDPLTAEEIEALLSRRVAAERSSSCPHGRPTVLKLSLAELDKQFKRT